MVKLPWDNFFINAVLGLKSDINVIIENDKVVLDMQNKITKETGPNPDLIIQLLRSDNEIPRDVRNFIADLLDPKANTFYAYKKFSSRKGGKIKHSNFNQEVAVFIENLINEGLKYDSAAEDTAKEFNLSESYVKKQFSFLKEARKAEKEVMEEILKGQNNP